MKMKKHLICAAALIACGPVALPAANATNGVFANIYDVQNIFSLPVTSIDIPGVVNELSHTESYDEPGGSGTTTALVYAMASYGVLKSAAIVTGSGQEASATVESFTGFADSFVIDAPGLTGQRGYFAATVEIPFMSSLQNPSRSGAELSWAITLSGDTDRYDDESYSEFVRNDDTGLNIFTRHDGNDISPVPQGDPVVLNVPFFYGSPITIFATMTTDARGQTFPDGGSFSAVMDASHSMYWEGISGVTDRDGNAVTGFSLSSDSGTDWTRDFAPTASTVPEPDAVMLLLVGLSVLGLRHGGYRQRQKLWRQAIGS